MPAITNVNELQAMNDDLAGNYWLANDIDASETATWNWNPTYSVYEGFLPLGTAITSFTGTFDGKSYTISNLYQYQIKNMSARAGFFYRARGTIHDVKLTNADITAKSISNNAAGGIFIYNHQSGGLIERCSAQGSLTMIAGGVGDLAYAGGFCALNNGIIRQCFANAIVSCSGEDAEACGFVDENYELIEDCYVRGSLTANATQVASANGFLWLNYCTDASAIINTSYSACQLAATGGASATKSGFVYDNDGGSINNCFWDTQTSGTEISDGGTGKTTAEMKLIATFSAWDIALSILDSNDGYPYLGWQIGESDTWLIYGLSPRPTTPIQDKITLETIRNIEMVAMGRFRVDKEGNAVYRSRYARNP